MKLIVPKLLPLKHPERLVLNPPLSSKTSVIRLPRTLGKALILLRCSITSHSQFNAVTTWQVSNPSDQKFSQLHFYCFTWKPLELCLSYSNENTRFRRDDEKLSTDRENRRTTTLNSLRFVSSVDFHHKEAENMHILWQLGRQYHEHANSITKPFGIQCVCRWIVHLLSSSEWLSEYWFR